MAKRLGRQTVALDRDVRIAAHAAVGGKKEGEGPLRRYFDYLCDDDTFGEKSWEKAESGMQRMCLKIALEKWGRDMESLDCLLAGDLLNQCISSSFAARDTQVPFWGLYGACSTMGESLALGALLIDGGGADTAGAVTSSHFCTAERQYRSPLAYGGQRAPTAQWTATAAGCAILSKEGRGPRITHITTGKIVDKGIKDANNMGAAMAPEDVKLAPCRTRQKVAGMPMICTNLAQKGDDSCPCRSAARCGPARGIGATKRILRLSLSSVIDQRGKFPGNYVRNGVCATRKNEHTMGIFNRFFKKIKILFTKFRNLS